MIWMLLPLLLSVAAPGGRADDDPKRGRELYAGCAACHGAEGEGNRSLAAPRLTHLAPVYVVAQLQKFKEGIRGGGSDASAGARQMAAMAATLADDQAMYDTAAYIATLGGGVSAITVKADPMQGASYYRQFCSACHGPAAEGNLALNSPRLAGADDWYLLAQLQAFRAGSRGKLAQDRTGKQMRAMAGVLPDDEAVADVVAYIRSLER
jgi:cytochrome c553